MVSQGRISRNPTSLYEGYDQARTANTSIGGTVPSGRHHIMSLVSPSSHPSSLNTGSLEPSRLAEIQEAIKVEYRIAAGARNLLAMLEAASRTDENSDDTSAAPISLAAAGAKDKANFEDRVHKELLAAESKIHCLEQEAESLAAHLKFSYSENASFSSSDTGTIPSHTESGSSRLDMGENEKDMVLIAHQAANVSEPEDSSLSDDELISLSSIMHTLQTADPASVTSQLLHTLYRLDRILMQASSLSNSDLHSILSAILPFLADQKQNDTSALARSDMRAAVYRIMRTIADFSTEAAQSFATVGIDLYLIKSLLSTKRYDREKEAALRLIRAAALVPTGKSLTWLTKGIVRTLVAMAEDENEKYRRMAILTTLELLIINPDLAAQSGAMTIALKLLSDGPVELARISVQCLSFIIDRQETRQLLCRAFDIEQVFSIFTSVVSDKDLPLAFLQVASAAILGFLETMPGILYLAHYKSLGLQSLCQALQFPSTSHQLAILALFEDIFAVGSSSSGKNTTEPLTFSLPAGDEIRRGIVLAVLLDAGLLSSLTYLITCNPIWSTQTNQRAVRLLIVLLTESHRLFRRLPESASRAFTALIAMATDFDDHERRNIAIDALRHLDHLSLRLLRRKPWTEAQKEMLVLKDVAHHKFRAASDEMDDSSETSQNLLQSSASPIVLYEDVYFRSLLIETQVLNTRDPYKWNLEIITDVLQGPLNQAKRFEEAMKGTKFMKRLFNAFRPQVFKQFFDSAPVRGAQDWINLGAIMLNTLQATPEGRLSLLEDTLLYEIADALKTTEKTQRGKISLSGDVAQGYTFILGHLSRMEESISILQKTNIFSAYYTLLDQLRRPDQICSVLRSLDLSQPGHARLIYQKAVCSPLLSTRQSVVEALSIALLSVEDSNWISETLLEMTLDEANEIRLAATAALMKAARADEVVQVLLRSCPVLEYFDDTAHPLLLRFTGSKDGLRYVEKIGFLQSELTDWSRFHSVLHGLRSECDIHRSSSLLQGRQVALDGVTSNPHFFAELCKTRAGCAIFRTHGPLLKYRELVSDAVRAVKMRTETCPDGLDAALWVMGHTGSSDTGFEMLDEMGAVEDLLRLATAHRSLSFRGRCLYTLGLLSLSSNAQTRLEEYGWQSTIDSSRGSSGICLPLDVQQICQFNMNSHLSVSQDIPLPLSNLPTMHQQLLNAVANLSNHIVATKASRSLSRLKATSPHLFTNVELFAYVLHMLDQSTLRLGVRRMVFDLFELSLDSSTISRINNALAQKVQESQKRSRTDSSQSPRLQGRDSDTSGTQLCRDLEDCRSEHEASQPSSASFTPYFRLTGFCI